MNSAFTTSKHPCIVVVLRPFQQDPYLKTLLVMGRQFLLGPAKLPLQKVDQQFVKINICSLNSPKLHLLLPCILHPHLHLPFNQGKNVEETIKQELKAQKSQSKLQ